MSEIWTWYIGALVALNLIGCVVLIHYTGRRRPGDAKPEDTSHVWDGDLTEYNKPMPRWWVNLFYITIVFAVGYLIYYPGIGAWAGVGGWSSAKELAQDQAAAEARLAPLFAEFAGQPLARLAEDDRARALGASIFANHCAMCHGSDARGSRGFPSLVDEAWNWGGSEEAILHSVTEGRQGVMPPFGAVLGSPQAVTEVAVYVQSLSGMTVDPALAAAGKPRFQAVCTACHGANGQGNPALGAPDLTDSIWQYGSDLDSIRTAINQGRQGVMPAHAPIIGAERSRLAAAHVYALSRQSNSASSGH